MMNDNLRVRLLASPDPYICVLSARACKKLLTDDDLTQHDAEKDIKTIEQVIARGHESILEHASFTFYVTGVSRILSHQLVRHRVASYAELSQRYADAGKMEAVVPDSIADNPDAMTMYRRSVDDANATYKGLKALGISDEDARYVLPEATATAIVITMNVRELRHFFALRCCNKAQTEIRNLTDAMLLLCKRKTPLFFADAGAPCKHCPEGKYACGHPRAK